MIDLRDQSAGLPDMDAAAFEQLVVDELDRLPDDMVAGLANVVFVVEDHREDGSLALLGLYVGWLLTERARSGTAGQLPSPLVLLPESHLPIPPDPHIRRDASPTPHHTAT